MFFNSTNIHIAIIYERMNDVNEEQAVFELLTLSNFKMWSSKIKTLQKLQANNDQDYYQKH